MRTRGWFARATAAGVFVIILTLLSTGAAGCGDEADASEGGLTLREADNGKTFAVKAGQTVHVVLPGNPTTGYAWMTALDDSSAALLEQEGEPAYVEESTDEDVVGAGGTYTFTFTSTTAGEATLKLVYARPWESVQPLETFEATIAIE